MLCCVRHAFARARFWREHATRIVANLPSATALLHACGGRCHHSCNIYNLFTQCLANRAGECYCYCFCCCGASSGRRIGTYLNCKNAAQTRDHIHTYIDIHMHICTYENKRKQRILKTIFFFCCGRVIVFGAQQ